MGKTLRYGSHDFPTKRGFSGSATDAKQVSVRPHSRADGKVISEHTRARRFKYGGDTTEGGAKGVDRGAAGTGGASRGAAGPGLGDSYGRMANGLGLAGQDNQGATQGSRFGNENAAIGALSMGNPNPTAARDAMSGALDKSLAVNSKIGSLNPTAVNVATNPLGVWGALVDLLTGADPTTNPDEVGDAVQQGSSIVSNVAPGPLGMVAGAVNTGATMGQANAALKAAIEAGAVQGKNIESNEGTISQEADGFGLHGAFNSGLTKTADLEHDINNGTFGGNMGAYAREGGGAGRPGQLPTAGAPLSQQMRNLSNAAPLFDVASNNIQPIIPTQTRTFKRGGRAKGTFHSKPLIGK